MGQAIIETSKNRLDNCETPRKCELNYGKLTRVKENTGEPPVLRRQERLSRDWLLSTVASDT